MHLNYEIYSMKKQTLTIATGVFQVSMHNSCLSLQIAKPYPGAVECLLNPVDRVQ